MNCNCGKEMKLPAVYIGRDSNGVSVVRFTCTCGHVVEDPIKLVPVYHSLKSGNTNLSQGDYFKYRNSNILLSCPICRFVNKLISPTVSDDGKIEDPFTCDNQCGFHSEVQLEDYSN